MNVAENSVKLIPVNKYKSRETYTIWIKDLESKSGIKLKENTKMDFQVK